MSRFLRLTNFLVNTSDIHKVVIHPNKYSIHVVSKKMDGFNWGIGMFSIGVISNYNYEIEVCETNHSTDYKIVTNWIRTHE
jgi:hypothetical protein